MSGHDRLKALARCAYAVRDLCFTEAERISEDAGRASREAEAGWKRAARLTRVLDVLPSLVALSRAARKALRTLESTGDDIAARAILMDAIADVDAATEEASRC